MRFMAATIYRFTVLCIDKVGGCAESSYDKNGKTITYMAAPALTSVKNPKAKTVTAAWKKSAGVNGYQIQYSTNNRFKKDNKTVNVKKAAAVTQTIKGLGKGKVFYFRIRSYKTVSKKPVYSAWSGFKKLKITK